MLITYEIKDLYGEEIIGTFYDQELSRTSQEVFRIEKILKRDKKHGRVFVKWSGFPDSFNSWVPLSSLSQASPNVLPVSKMIKFRVLLFYFK